MFLSHQITYQLKFSWLKRVWVIVNEFLSRNRRFDLKWPRLTFDLQKSRCPILAYLRSLLVQKNLLKMVTCVRHISRKFQFCKSIFSKFWIFLDLETKILINFSTPKNPYITFLDRSRNTQKSRCSFSFNPPFILLTYIILKESIKKPSGTGTYLWKSDRIFYPYLLSKHFKCIKIFWIGVNTSKMCLQ